MKLILIVLVFLTTVILSKSYPISQEPANDIFDDLIKEVNDIEGDIKSELDKLAKAGRAGEGALLIRYEQNGQSLIDMIEKNKPKIVPGTQTLIQQLKDNVAKEIARLEPTGDANVNDPIVDKLLIEASKLRRAAVELIHKLEAEGKHELAVGLQKLETLVADAAQELQKLDPTSPLAKKAEEWLQKTMHKLEDEIKHLKG